MRMYEVAVPITGFQVLRVEAESPDDAIQQVLEGNFDPYDSEYDKVELDLDANNADVWEVDEA